MSKKKKPNLDELSETVELQSARIERLEELAILVCVTYKSKYKEKNMARINEIVNEMELRTIDV